jgi:outer membrane protein OmpA-like peptidoglycan-associated protein
MPKFIKLMFMGMLFLLTSNVFAQDTSVYNVFDSSVVPSKGQTQQSNFMNNTYDFPAKPRNQTEIGVSGGLFTISGDVSSKLPTGGFSVHVRKALGYIFSLRAQYVYGVARGLNWKPSFGYSNDHVWDAYTATNFEPVYYNYKTTVNDLSLQGIFTLNNVRFHKQKSGMAIYVGVGLGATVYNAKVQVPNNPQGFSSIQQITDQYSNRKKTRDALKDLLKDVPYTAAENENNTKPTLGSHPLRATGTGLAGIAFKLSKRVNLAIEDRVTFTKDDLLDGQQWQEHPFGDPAQTRDFDTYNYFSVGLNFNVGSKSVEPLWWVNPLDYAYSEINNPKHMKLPKPVYEDADDDGVVDQLDREPNTEAGCPVDTHGVSRDSDGDGVPDCKDKQLITPTECQPVDADGVGKCPEPECCKTLAAQATMCNLGDLPSISFKNRSAQLSSDAKAMLASVASRLKNSASCNITITGYPAASKTSQALCNKRLEAIKTYLTEKEGISADRITTNGEVGGGDVNTIDLRAD